MIKEKHPIRQMFDGIACRYDFMNHFLSMGRDRAWRQRALCLLNPQKGESVVDLCAGTGDFLGKSPWMKDSASLKIVVDFSFNMLSLAPEKYPGTQAVQADSHHLPFADNFAHILLNGFGLRNLDRLEEGLEEACRVLAPGGHFLILEFFRPTGIFARIFHYVLAPIYIPLAGRLLSRSPAAYKYLLRSIRNFHSLAEFTQLCNRRGFRVSALRACDGGIAHIILLQKPAGFHNTKGNAF